MTEKGKALVGKAAGLVKDETFGLLADAREAKVPLKEGVASFTKRIVHFRTNKEATEQLSSDAASEEEAEKSAGEERAEQGPSAEGHKEYFKRLREETNMRAFGKPSRN